MSNNNDDDGRGAPHTDRSAEGSYTDLPTFRGFIGWVSNKGGGAEAVRSQVLTFTRITQASTESPIIIAVST